jgi:peroxiredoxin
MMIKRVHILRRTLMLAVVPFVVFGCLGPSDGPVAVLSSDVVTGAAPLDVGFDLSFTYHPRGESMTFSLDFGDGSSPESGTEFGLILHHTYEEGGTYQASLLVADEDGNSDTATLTITVNETGPQVGVEVGNTAPDFTGHTTDGGTVTLSDYRGQVVLLDFWGAWCPPCRNSMPHLDELVSQYKAQGLVAIIVSTDVTEQDAIDFLATHGLTQFISVWEPGGKQANPIDVLYQVTNYPTTFVLDRQGVIRWISIGYPGTLTEDMLESLL